MPVGRHLLLLLAAAAGTAAEGVETSWSLSQILERDDENVIWAAPTAIDTSIARHDFTYEITGVSIFYGGIIEPDDETDKYAAANSLSGSGAIVGYPGGLWQQTLDEPVTDTTFDLDVTVGSDGIGRATFSNIELGEVPPVFSGNPIPIDGLLIEATITLTESTILPGDYNNNGVVDQSDYSVWSAFFGSTTVLLADGNGDGIVDAADYTVWRDNLMSPLAVSIPEPTAIGFAFSGVFGGLLIGRRRVG